jgi:two-component system chemotaxis sensor kinase CheA
MLDRFSFMSFLQDASTLVQRITAPPEANGAASLRRTLHTLKGNASAMGLAVVAELCHAMETELVEKGSMAPSTVAALHSRWSAIREHVETFVRARGPRVIEVPETEYTALIARLSSTDRDSELLQQILSWQLEPAHMVLSRLGEQAKSLALRLGRGPIDVEVSCGNVRLDMRHWAPFFSELVHVVRNAVDHGLESPEERRALGKPSKGKLTLAACVEAGELTFEVGDDGRGIDWAAIVEGAKERGLPHSTQAELLDALCEDGLTTRRVATDISGRGIGMSAFRRRLDALSGALEVRSSKGAGTSWLMHFHWPVEGRIAELSVRPSKPGGSASARCPPSEQNLG